MINRLVKATGLIAQQYPYTYLDLQRSHPEISFPDTPTPELLASFDVYPVQETTPPSHDETTHRLKEEKPVHTDGVWYQVWSLRPAATEEAEGAVQSKKYGALRSKLSSTRPQQSVPALRDRIEALEQFLGLKPIP